MEAKGKIKITDELILTNPTLSIKSVLYDWEGHKVDIELIFIEEGATFKHSRAFTYDVNPTGEMTTTDIYNFITNDDVLKEFK